MKITLDIKLNNNCETAESATLTVKHIQDLRIDVAELKAEIKRLRSRPVIINGPHRDGK